MPIPVTSTLDMGQNQILHIVIHGGADFPVSPSPINGQLYFKTGTNQGFYYYEASSWRPVGDITGVNATPGGGLTGGAASGEVNLVVNTDGTTLEVNSGTNQVRIRAGGVAANELASNAVTTIKIQDGAVTLGKIGSLGTMTLVGRVSAGTGAAEAIAIINDGTLATATATNIATASAVKTYVDNRLSGLGSLVGAFNATTNTNFPANPAAGGTKKGDYWYVTVAGTVQGVALNVGDVIIANKDAASGTVVADWIFVESNRDQATETVLGVIALATQAEVNAGSPGTKAVTPVTLAARTATETRTGLIAIATTALINAGTDDSTAVTPLKLTQFLNSNQLNLGFNIPTAPIAAGGTVTVTHNLNTRDLTCDLWRVSDNQKCLVDATAPTVNTVVVTFGQAQSANTFRLVIGRR